MMTNLSGKGTLSRRLAAGLAMAFSALSLLEGSRVLLGVSMPDYVVLPVLVGYNVILGAVGFGVGVGLWMNRRRAFAIAGVVTGTHLLVLLTVVVLHFSGGSVSMNSVQAMLVRSGVWILVTWVAWKSKDAGAV